MKAEKKNVCSGDRCAQTASLSRRDRSTHQLFVISGLQMSGLTEAKSLKVTPRPSTWGVLVSQDPIFRHDELTRQAGSQNMQNSQEASQSATRNQMYLANGCWTFLETGLEVKKLHSLLNKTRSKITIDDKMIQTVSNVQENQHQLRQSANPSSAFIICSKRLNCWISKLL